MNKLQQIVYVSTAVRPYTNEELQNMLKLFRTNNQLNDISGMLLYHDGSFMQVIEGEETKIRKLLALIEADPSHKGLIILIDEPIETREFGDWSMAYHDLTGSEQEGFSTFFHQTGAELSHAPGKARKLLSTFKQYL